MRGWYHWQVCSAPSHHREEAHIKCSEQNERVCQSDASYALPLVAWYLHMPRQRLLNLCLKWSFKAWERNSRRTENYLRENPLASVEIHQNMLPILIHARCSVQSLQLLQSRPTESLGMQQTCDCLFWRGRCGCFEDAWPVTAIHRYRRWEIFIAWDGGAQQAWFDSCLTHWLRAEFHAALLQVKQIQSVAWRGASSPPWHDNSWPRDGASLTIIRRAVHVVWRGTILKNRPNLLVRSVQIAPLLTKQLS